MPAQNGSPSAAQQAWRRPRRLRRRNMATRSELRPTPLRHTVPALAMALPVYDDGSGNGNGYGDGNRPGRGNMRVTSASAATPT